MITLSIFIDTKINEGINSKLQIKEASIVELSLALSNLEIQRTALINEIAKVSKIGVSRE